MLVQNSLFKIIALHLVFLMFLPIAMVSADTKKDDDLIFAIGHQQIDKVKSLIKESMPINRIIYPLGYSPLYFVFHGNYNESIVKQLLNSSADPNFPGYSEDGKTPTGDTPMSSAIRGNELEAVKLMTAKGGNVNTKYCFKKEDSCLLFSIKSGNLEMAKLLIKSGADVNVKVGRHTLLYEIKEMNKGRTYYNEIISVLIASGAKEE